MRRPSRPLPSREGSRWWTPPLPWLGLAVCALATAGCQEGVRHVGGSPKTQAKAKAPAPPQFIVGKRTQDIRNAAAELQKGGAQLGTTRITAKDYLTLQGNAYVAIIGRTAELQIQQALELYRAMNDRYPKDYDEFMNEIIRANNIALPQLPSYQKYGYDEKEHKLIILEYPALKEQPAR
jgi:hypothetical protein